MLKKFILVSLILFALTLSGCTVSANLFPIEGPLAQSSEAVVIPCSFTYNGFGIGKVTITMPDGEVLKGKYVTRDNSAYGMNFGSMFSRNYYAQYYGNSFSFSGCQYGSFVATGDKGTVLQGEYWVNLTNHGSGFAKDNHGNLYKFMW